MRELNDLQKEFIEHIARTKALEFGNFTLVDGRETPYYFNLAKTMNDGLGAYKMASICARAIKIIVGLNNFDYIHALAYKAIPLGSLIGYKLLTLYGTIKRCGYNRKEEKTHGDEGMLVGDIRDQDRVLIIDDTITEGGTKIRTIKKLLEETQKKDIEISIIGIFVGIHRKELSEENQKILEKNDIQVFHLVTIRQVISYLYQRKVDGYIYVDEQEANSFWKYFEKYGRS